MKTRAEDKIQQLKYLGGDANVGQEVIVYGTGGHSRVIRELVELCGHKVAYFLDDAPRATHVDNVPVQSRLSTHTHQAMVLGIGDNRTRLTLAHRLTLEAIDDSGRWVDPLVHPRAYVSSRATLGMGTVVLAGAIVGPGASVGSHCIINTLANVEHDCVLDDFASVAPNAVMGGGSTLGEGSFLGMNATLLQNRMVGAWSIIGSGAVVIDDIPERSLAVGVPANPIRAIRESDTPF